MYTQWEQLYLLIVKSKDISKQKLSEQQQAIILRIFMKHWSQTFHYVIKTGLFARCYAAVLFLMCNI